MFSVCDLQTPATFTNKRLRRMGFADAMEQSAYGNAKGAHTFCWKFVGVQKSKKTGKKVA